MKCLQTLGTGLNIISSVQRATDWTHIQIKVTNHGTIKILVITNKETQTQAVPVVTAGPKVGHSRAACITDWLK